MVDHLIRRICWWLCLFVAPTILVGIELFHPADFTHNPGMYAYLCGPQPYATEHRALAYWGPEWWFQLHMIQTPLVALVTAGLWQMLSVIGPAERVAPVLLAWAARGALLLFVTYYTVLDGIGGIALGKNILTLQDLQLQGKITADQAQGAILLLNTVWLDPWIGGIGSFVSLTGSWAVFAASTLAAAALGLAGKAPWPALLLLAGFGWVLHIAHVMPYGPVAFSLLILAAGWIRLFPDRFVWRPALTAAP